MKFNKGDLVTMDSSSAEDAASGQQYFPDIIKEANYLGVATRLNGRYTEVMWLRHPTRINDSSNIRTVALKKVLV